MKVTRKKYHRISIKIGDKKHELNFKMPHPKLYSALMDSIMENPSVLQKIMKENLDGDYSIYMKIQSPIFGKRLFKRVKIIEFETNEDYNAYLTFLNAMKDHPDKFTMTKKQFLEVTEESK